MNNKKWRKQKKNKQTNKRLKWMDNFRVFFFTVHLAKISQKNKPSHHSLFLDRLNEWMWIYRFFLFVYVVLWRKERKNIYYSLSSYIFFLYLPFHKKVCVCVCGYLVCNTHILIIKLWSMMMMIKCCCWLVIVRLLFYRNNLRSFEY